MQGEASQVRTLPGALSSVHKPSPPGSAGHTVTRGTGPWGMAPAAPEAPHNQSFMGSEDSDHGRALPAPRWGVTLALEPARGPRCLGGLGTSSWPGVPLLDTADQLSLLCLGKSLPSSGLQGHRLREGLQGHLQEPLTPGISLPRQPAALLSLSVHRKQPAVAAVLGAGRASDWD